MAKWAERKPPVFEGDKVRFDVSTNAHPGVWAIVDAADWAAVQGIRWSATKRMNGLYVRNAKLGLLHRYLLGPDPSMVVDHRNGNPLDNTRSNIRVCTQAFNNQARFDRERGFALIVERTEKSTAPHVVKRRLATGEIREYRYPTRSKTGTKKSVVCKILPAR